MNKTLREKLIRKHEEMKDSMPSLYNMQWVEKAATDGWNQLARKQEADGTLRFRLLNAVSLSAVTLSGIREEASCNLHALLQSRDRTLLEEDYPASLIYSKDGMGWFKVSDQTYFIVQF